MVVDRRYVVYGEPTWRAPWLASEAHRNTAMNRLLSAHSRRARLAIASMLLSAATSSFALNTATIVSSTLSPDCLEYRVVGICYWLFCTWTGCTVRISEGAALRAGRGGIELLEHRREPVGRGARDEHAEFHGASGGDGTTNHDNENNLAKFKNADVIGHPGGSVFSQFASASGYACQGAGTAFMPYLLSTLDTLAWRYNVPEMVYPEALIPGMREIGGRTTLNLWGNVYPAGLPASDRRLQERRRGRAACGRRRDPAHAAARLSAAARVRATATGRPARWWKATPPRANGRS